MRAYRLLLVLAVASAIGCNKTATNAGTDAEAAPVTSAVPTEPAAARLIRDYWSQQNCVDRAKFILSSDAHRQALSEQYKSEKSCARALDSIEASECDSVPAGKYCAASAKAGKDNFNYCIKNEAGTVKIDWLCSRGHNATPLVVFKAQRSKTPVVFRVNAKISDYYNYEYMYSQKTHHSAKLSAGDTREDIQGYIKKASPDGEALFDVLKDGKWHAVMLELVYGKNSQDSSIATITRLVAKDWAQRPEEVGEIATAIAAQPAPTESSSAPAPASTNTTGGGLKECCDALAALSKQPPQQPSVMNASSACGALVAAGQGEMVKSMVQNNLSCVNYPPPCTPVAVPTACK